MDSFSCKDHRKIQDTRVKTGGSIEEGDDYYHKIVKLCRLTLEKSLTRSVDLYNCIYLYSYLTLALDSTELAH